MLLAVGGRRDLSEQPGDTQQDVLLFEADIPLLYGCPAAPRSDKEAEVDEAREAAAKAEADKEARRVSRAAASRAQLVAKLQHLLKQVGTSAVVLSRCDCVSFALLHLLQQALWSHLHCLACCCGSGALVSHQHCPTCYCCCDY
jgi:hypothetical protein